MTNQLQHEETLAPAESRAQLLLSFILYISPVALLTTIFPLVTPEMSRQTIGGVSLTSIILAASITVPWLSQAVCLPLYRAIEAEHKAIADAREAVRIEADFAHDRRKFQLEKELRASLNDARYQDISDIAAFTRSWLYIFLVTAPLTLLFALPLAFILGWSGEALITFLILGVLNVAFAQLLMIPNLSKNRWVWAIAWGGFTAALYFFPLVWFLPPTVGSIILLIALGKDIAHLFHFRIVPLKNIAGDALRGFLTGSVLWADKYVFFIAANGTIDVVAIYLSLIPTVIAYNYFFVAEAESINSVIARMWTLFDSTPLPQMKRESAQILRTSNRAMARTLGLAVICSVITGVLMAIFLPHTFPLAFSGLIVAFLFLVITLLNYQIEYMTMFITVQLIGAAHLVAAIIIFALNPSEWGYIPLMVADALIAFAAYRIYHRAWAAPEYSLFWKRALAW